MYISSKKFESLYNNLKQFCIQHQLGIKEIRHNYCLYYSFYSVNEFEEKLHFHIKSYGYLDIDEKNLTDEQKIQLSVFLPKPLIISSSEKLLSYIRNNPKDIPKLGNLFKQITGISSNDIIPFIYNITTLKSFQNIFKRFNVEELQSFQNLLEEKFPKLKESPDYIKIFPKKTLDTCYSIVIKLTPKEIAAFNKNEIIFNFDEILIEVFQELNKRKIFENDFCIEYIKKRKQYLFVSDSYDFYANQEKFLETIFTILHHMGKTPDINQLMTIFENNHILENLKFNDDELTVVKKVRKI